MKAVGLAPDRPGEERVRVEGAEFARHDKVRLRLGQRRSDAADVLLVGRVATIETIYRDYDGKVYLGVTLDDDPAQDMQRELGRYMFFFPDEVEVIKAGNSPRVPDKDERTEQ